VPGTCHLPFALARTNSTVISAKGCTGRPAAARDASVSAGMAGREKAAAILADRVVATTIGSP
jgi:hypothetical protein